MKKLIIASQICMIPFILLGLVVPVLMIRKDNADINMNIFYLYAIILALSIAVIMTTVVFMGRYTDVIDRMDEEQKVLENKRDELSMLISKYNKMLISFPQPKDSKIENYLRFAEWAYVNGWCFVEGNVWVNYDRSVSDSVKTTPELFQLFDQEKDM